MLRTRSHSKVCKEGRRCFERSNGSPNWVPTFRQLLQASVTVLYQGHNSFAPVFYRSFGLHNQYITWFYVSYRAIKCACARVRRWKWFASHCAHSTCPRWRKWFVCAHVTWPYDLDLDHYLPRTLWLCCNRKFTMSNMFVFFQAHRNFWVTQRCEIQTTMLKDQSRCSMICFCIKTPHVPHWSTPFTQSITFCTFRAASKLFLYH